MSTAVPHYVTYACPIPASEGSALSWVAYCTCGKTSEQDGSPDGTMASARQWRDEHLEACLPPDQFEPASPPPDKPDSRTDSYDGWLRELTNGQ